VTVRLIVLDYLASLDRPDEVPTETLVGAVPGEAETINDGYGRGASTVTVVGAVEGEGS
jgi:hypothetical protein